MSQEIEIEFKTLVSEKDFTTLKHALPFPEEPIKQINYYFETKDFKFKQHQSALRIRKKGDSYTLTLKQPHPDGILETHDSLSAQEFLQWTNGNPVPKEHTAHQLDKMNIPLQHIMYYGALETERMTYKKDSILYVLDKSNYHQSRDYELEIEAATYEAGKAAFDTLLTTNQINRQPPISKIERFFKAIGEIN